jgi:hypothetical protein
MTRQRRWRSCERRDRSAVAVTNVEKILKALHGEGGKFIIIGGSAAVLHGSAYVTADLNICYSRERENLQKLGSALAPFNVSLRGAPTNLPFQFDADSIRSGLNFTLTTALGDLDILGEITGLGSYEEALQSPRR